MYCEFCKLDFDNMIYPDCPYCNKLLPIDINDISTPNTDEQKMIEQQNFQLLSKDTTMKSEINFNIVCPNCGFKNQRNKRFCINCLELLQNFTPNMERENLNSAICSGLDHKTLMKFFNITARCFIMYHFKIEFNKTCQKCGNKVDWYLDNCNKCGQLTYFYQCYGSLKNGMKCTNKIKIFDQKCSICGNEVFYSYFKKLMMGKIRGKTADDIFDKLEELFSTDLRKDTFSALRINQGEIQQIKSKAEQMCGNGIELLETFSKALKDFTYNSNYYDDIDFKDAISSMKDMPWLNNEIITPPKSTNVLDIMDKRKKQIAGENIMDDNTEDEDPISLSNISTNTNTTSKNDEEENDDDPDYWSPYENDDE